MTKQDKHFDQLHLAFFEWPALSVDGGGTARIRNYTV
jgi:hypothetical protein